MRYKTLIGRRFRARTLPTQQTEAAVSCKVLTIMTHFWAGWCRSPSPAFQRQGLNPAHL